MARPLHLHLLHHLRRYSSAYASPMMPFCRLSLPNPICLRSLSTATRYPLQYDMIISRPVNPPSPASSRRRPPPARSRSEDSNPDSDVNFDDWVDMKLSGKDADGKEAVMDKAKRKYYNKRRKRMYGESESEEESGRRENESEFIELKREVVEPRTLFHREQELYFYDTFAYPWEKNKHYKMAYQLEKKYFPDQGFDKAFLPLGESNAKRGKKELGRKGVEDDKRLVFFDENEKDGKVGNDSEKKAGDVTEMKVGDVTEKKVEEFFKCLKKFPNEKDGDVAVAEPFLSTRSAGLPPKWDGPNGTVVLVNKPKGWTSFTVCGKLRRLVKVKKVGHAGTLDPMATGLLIVCVGKATKLVDRYQGMIKGYSGIFRLGEATSTWDADSPVIQREPWEHIKDEDIKKAAVSLSGEIYQVPPMFSAIKVGGERMYDKARKGETVELSPRRISIFNFDVERSLNDRQNVIFRVTCSKGTYVRSLCADFGKALGSCAHLTALRRDSIGEYLADDAWEFQELEEQITKGYI